MATQTAAQKKAAAKKAAEAKTKAAETTTQPATAEAQTQTTAQGDTTTQAQAGVGDTQGAGDPQTSGDQSQAQPIPTVFDQAVQFSMSGHASGRTAPNAGELWDAFACEAMPPMLAVAVFDCAVTQGAKITAILLSKLGISAKDGQVDPESIETLADRDEGGLVIDFLAWRLRRYAFTANAPSNMREWSQHILQLQAFVLSDLQTG
ncbi:hypothetical protein AIOL_000943 [Candidatus Rhodobacter oscarellae]|uniref:Uncharacterized protein n=1 Tax=Candidatus Rhodobacter oscarellae TaxID=1675527 RepID=A0A0J9H5B4_9RHOB|nr:hypothetical protein [Candidatus Rhodobacter lobularis]KMW60778.1 hypothetical protein AIOL_000943 [Candidatus Rhodobacter lobularis]